MEREEKKKLALLKKRKRSRPQDRPSSSSDESSRSSFNLEDEESGNEMSDDREMEIPTNDIKAIKEGDFVLVSFMGGKRNASRFVYLCCLQAIEGDEFKVLGFKSIDNSARSFVANEDDVSTVTSRQIIGILSAPAINMKERRLTYTFPKKLGINEKC